MKATESRFLCGSAMPIILPGAMLILPDAMLILPCAPEATLIRPAAIMAAARARCTMR